MIHFVDREENGKGGWIYTTRRHPRTQEPLFKALCGTWVSVKNMATDQKKIECEKCLSKWCQG